MGFWKIFAISCIVVGACLLLGGVVGVGLLVKAAIVVTTFKKVAVASAMVAGAALTVIGTFGV